MIFELHIWDWVVNCIGITFLIMMILVIIKMLQEIWDNWKFDKYIRNRDTKGVKNGGKIN